MSLPVRDAAGAVPGRGEGGFRFRAGAKAGFDCRRAPSDCRTSVWESRHARNDRPRVVELYSDELADEPPSQSLIRVETMEQIAAMQAQINAERAAFYKLKSAYNELNSLLTTIRRRVGFDPTELAMWDAVSLRAAKAADEFPQSNFEWAALEKKEGGKE